MRRLSKSLTYKDILLIIKHKQYNQLNYHLNNNKICFGCHKNNSNLTYYTHRDGYYIYSRCSLCKYALFEVSSQYIKLSEKDLFTLRCLL